MVVIVYVYCDLPTVCRYFVPIATALNAVAGDERDGE